MKTEKVFWTDYSILVCTKCQNKIVIPEPKPIEPINIAESIKTKFKTELNDMGYKGKVRVMISSCLGVCPSGFQAVSMVSTTDPTHSLSYVFDPLVETETVLTAIKNKLSL